MAEQIKPRFFQLMAAVALCGVAILTLRAGAQQQQAARTDNLSTPASDEPIPTARHLQQNTLPRIRGVGNGGVGDAFPLGLCEGDCDSDRDCAGNLVCFQRNAREAVPGCRGGEADRSRGDFCVRPGATTTTVAPPPPPNTGGPVVSSTGSFVIKLYWERGYFWQEERFERKWCMKCRSGRCNVNNQIYIIDCDRERPTRFAFRNQGANRVQIQIAGSNLCLERNGRRDIRVQRCAVKTAQLWTAPRGGFSGRRFEIAPINNRQLCMTQRHHPRRGEIVQLESCDPARRDTTTYWNRY